VQILEASSDRDVWASGFRGLRCRAYSNGTFLAKAAWQYDPDQATGIAGALRALKNTSYGSPLLGIMAIGFART
jgi:hypothetical protein